VGKVMAGLEELLVKVRQLRPDVAGFRVLAQLSRICVMPSSFPPRPDQGFHGMEDQEFSPSPADDS
jgi:hypothetical protein